MNIIFEDTRQIMLPAFLKFIRDCIEGNDELELCSSIFSEILEFLFGKVCIYY